jgi:hypothetical protein
MCERKPALAAADHQPTNSTASRAVDRSATATSLADTRPPSALRPYVGKHRCPSTSGPYLMLLRSDGYDRSLVRRAIESMPIKRYVTRK